MKGGTYKNLHGAETAVDGKVSTFTLTRSYRNPWIAIDLGSRMIVTEVEVRNRPDWQTCCSKSLTIPYFDTYRDYDYTFEKYIT